jgi:hypothetical protein
MDKLKNNKFFKNKIYHLAFILLTFYLFYTYTDFIILLYCYFAISLTQKNITYSLKLKCTDKNYESYVKLAFVFGVLTSMSFIVIIHAISIFYF